MRLFRSRCSPLLTVGFHVETTSRLSRISCPLLSPHPARASYPHFLVLRLGLRSRFSILGVTLAVTGGSSQMPGKDGVDLVLSIDSLSGRWRIFVGSRIALGCHHRWCWCILVDGGCWLAVWSVLGRYTYAHMFAHEILAFLQPHRLTLRLFATRSVRRCDLLFLTLSIQYHTLSPHIENLL